MESKDGIPENRETLAYAKEIDGYSAYLIITVLIIAEAKEFYCQMYKNKFK